MQLIKRNSRHFSRRLSFSGSFLRPFGLLALLVFEFRFPLTQTALLKRRRFFSIVYMLIVFLHLI
jgi:hypothetical protein